ncbi:MAG: T9SS type A sorting domain-containing protein [Chitinophagales bacterium]|nr:T9SS type A sorting domain-containing protein [Chitinophagales bacterium]MDW8427397.1 hypothetical protein [Chitinophagales bacterium]
MLLLLRFAGIMIFWSALSAAAQPWQQVAEQFQSPKVPPLNQMPFFVEAPPPEASYPHQIEPAPAEAATIPQAQTRGFTTVDIGYTYFDLQTNASVAQAFWRNETDGRLFAVWNFVPELDPQLSKRGTGYNYFYNSVWQNFPQQRLESFATGWPNIIITHDNQSELILAHNLTLGVIQKTVRAPVVSGTWVEYLSPFAGPEGHRVWWPRIVRGDNIFGNRYLHAVALTLPRQQGGTKFKGLDGALLYYRSKDNGASWDKTNVLIAAFDSTQFARIRPDNYAIDAYQNNVAIVVGGYGNDLILALSPDNGLTWNKIIVQHFPIDRFYDQITDVNGDGIAEWLDTNDGSLAVLIDKGGIVHVWAGYAQIFNADSTDNTFNFNPYANGILYWNTTMLNQPMKLITGAVDMTGDDSLAIGPLGFFNSGLATHPSAGTDAQGNLWLSFSAINELGRDSDGKSVRHTYVIGSTYGGQNWSYPYSVVPEVNAEAIYAKVSRSNDFNIRLIYQKDFCAGISLSYGFPDPCNSGKVNQIVYVEVPANEILTSCPQPAQANARLQMFPNPAHNFAWLVPPPLPDTDAILEVFSLNNERIFSESVNLSAPVKINVSTISPGLYLLRCKTATTSLQGLLVVSY